MRPSERWNDPPKFIEQELFEFQLVSKCLISELPRLVIRPDHVTLLRSQILVSLTPANKYTQRNKPSESMASSPSFAAEPYSVHLLSEAS